LGVSPGVANELPAPIPAALGVAAFVQLRLLLRRETEAIKLCNPGDTMEIIGLGPATIDRPGGETDREHPVRTRGVGRTGFA
jgi:hypothetical protein